MDSQTFDVDLVSPTFDADLDFDLQMAELFSDPIEDPDFLVRENDELFVMLDFDQQNLFGSHLPSPVSETSANEPVPGSLCHNTLRTRNDNTEVKVNLNAKTACEKREEGKVKGKENVIPVVNRYQPRILRKPEIKKSLPFCQITTTTGNGPKSVSQLVQCVGQGQGQGQGVNNLAFFTPLGHAPPFRHNRVFDMESTITPTPAMKGSKANTKPTFWETPKSSTGMRFLLPRRLFKRIST